MENANTESPRLRCTAMGAVLAFAAAGCAFPDVSFVSPEGGSGRAPGTPGDGAPTVGSITLDDATTTSPSMAGDATVPDTIDALAPPLGEAGGPVVDAAPADPGSADAAPASIAEGGSDAAAASFDEGGPDASGGGLVEAAAPADAGAADSARADAPISPGPCPAVCTGGCGASGTTCTILVKVPKQADIRCPPGRACVVHCAGTQVCADYFIYCAAGQPCTVVCEGDEACSSNTIARGAASSLCVECIASGNPGCNSAVCIGACSSHCVGVGGCGDSCLNCAPVAACPR